MKPMRIWLFSLALLPLLAQAFPQPAVAGGISDRDMLLDTAWQWEISRYNNDTQAVPENPEKYTLVFGEDGRFRGLADCNRIRGNYTLSGSSITIRSISSTRAMCPPGSLDKAFLKDLERAAILFFKGDRLYLDLAYHSGTMAFLSSRGESGTMQGAEVADAVLCKDPRPEVCTAEYDPVCGEKKDNSKKTYSNGCQACADPAVIRYRKGECP